MWIPLWSAVRRSHSEERTSSPARHSWARGVIASGGWSGWPTARPAGAPRGQTIQTFRRRRTRLDQAHSGSKNVPSVVKLVCRSTLAYRSLQLYRSIHYKGNICPRQLRRIRSTASAAKFCIARPCSSAKHCASAADDPHATALKAQKRLRRKQAPLLHSSRPQLAQLVVQLADVTRKQQDKSRSTYACSAIATTAALSSSAPQRNSKHQQTRWSSE